MSETTQDKARRGSRRRSKRSLDRSADSLAQLTIGAYRQAFFDAMGEAGDMTPVTYCGEHHFDASLQYGVRLQQRPRKVINHFILGGRAVWQSGVVTRAVASRGHIGELNPRIVSGWITVVLRRLAGKKTVLWGHATGRSATQQTPGILRRLMLRLGGGMLAYTHDEAEIIANTRGLSKVKTFVAPNALYSASQMRFESVTIRTDFIVSARLISSKRVDLAVRGFSEAMSKLPAESRLHIVGQGPKHADISQLIHDLHLEGSAIMHGDMHQLAGLRALYSTSVAALSPGYVGLNITQAYSFGVPLIYIIDEPHAPEVVLAKDLPEGAVGVRTIEEMVEAMITLSRRVDEERERVGTKLAAFTRDSYSAELMAAGFRDAMRWAGSHRGQGSER